MRGLPEHDRFDDLDGYLRRQVSFIADHWFWTGGAAWGSNTSSSYGFLSVRVGRRYGERYVHRVVFGLLIGPIPAGMVIDHRCGETRCCKPSHLEAVTRQMNSHRRHYPAGLTDDGPAIVRLDIEPWTAWTEPPLPLWDQS